MYYISSLRQISIELIYPAHDRFIKRDSSTDQVRRECDERNLQYTSSTNWTNLLRLIKSDEGDDKFFKPMTSYDAFKWNETHYE